MPIIQNVSPVGDLDVPLLRRIVKRDEHAEVTNDQAARLLPQGIWLPVDPAAEAIQTALDVVEADNQKGSSE